MHVPKKIPTAAAFFFIILVLIGISVVIQQTTRGETTASASLEPKNILMTNVTDTSLTVIWETDTPASGLISLSQAGKKISAFDERDLSGKVEKYRTHSVSVKNLLPGTTYDMQILSDGKKFPVATKPYVAKTGTALPATATPNLEPSYGTVKLPSGTPAQGALVVLTLEDSQTVSTLVKASGAWIIPLNLLRTKDLSSYVTVTKGTVETLTFSLDGQRSEVITDVDNDSPVPDVTLGTPYDFRNQQAKKPSASQLVSLTDSQNTKPLVLGEQTQIQSFGESQGILSITSPKPNTSLTSPKPLFQGTGIPGKSVLIALGITKVQTAKVTVSSQGKWTYTPAKSLVPGQQSITATSTDARGKPTALTVEFIILKSGSQVLGDATPSATIEPTPITEEPTPTPESTLSAEPMPNSGSTLPTVLLLVFGGGLLLGSIFLMTRSNS